MILQRKIQNKNEERCVTINHIFLPAATSFFLLAYCRMPQLLFLSLVTLGWIQRILYSVESKNEEANNTDSSIFSKDDSRARKIQYSTVVKGKKNLLDLLVVLQG